MAKSYTAQLADLAKLRNSQVKAIAADAIQDVMEAAQTPQLGMTRGATSFEIGKIPVADADLINSLSSSVGDGSVSIGPESYELAIGDFEVGDRLQFEWTVEHALPMEAGYTKELKDGSILEVPGRQFVGYNAAQFSDFVEAHTKEITGGK